MLSKLGTFFGALVGDKEAKKGLSEDDMEIRISRNKLRALLDSYDANVVNCLNKTADLAANYREFTETMTTRIKALDGKYGIARKELVEQIAANEELASANAELTSKLETIAKPEDCDEAVAAKELLRWGYTEEQLPAILQIAKENEALLVEAAKDEDGEPIPLLEVLRSKRFLIELALKNKGIVRGTTPQQGASLPGIQALDKGF